ncbi:hypothetical protein NDU88_009031 [Pleurodeles waltl]|uniref:Uncharacterized protein n=1 Tax=Pleurodeles waltl TaxID=8319 RepID=A0AAV7PRA1_PLEWA|nr:hypothetical protein NDU88_009031 [Pleurodeles waltl]
MRAGLRGIHVYWQAGCCVQGSALPVEAVHHHRHGAGQPWAPRAPECLMGAALILLGCQPHAKSPRRARKARPSRGAAGQKAGCLDCACAGRPPCAGESDALSRCLRTADGGLRPCEGRQKELAVLQVGCGLLMRPTRCEVAPACTGWHGWCSTSSPM